MKVAVSLAIVLSMIGFSISADADNSKCWGIGGDDRRRPEISCAPLTEKRLLELRGMTRQEVIAEMNAAGEPSENGRLHYVVNSKSYSGFMLITFSDNRVSNIDATVQPADDSLHSLEFIWNASGEMCSDFPGSQKRCNEK
jgi:hypothetical protein